jgi:hypothetical protein
VTPKGPLWQSLRQAALFSIPEGTLLRPGIPNSLREWQIKGYYTVRRVSGTGFELEVSGPEIGSVLLADAENLLDAAAEHQVSIWRHINANYWLSPAWLSVTTYYWAFFLLLALSRLLGKTTWYIDREVGLRLVRLANIQSARPGQGCFRLEVGKELSISGRQLTLRKRGGRVHDEIWRNWDQICRQDLSPLLQGTANSMEDRLFTVVIRVNNVLGPEWPSAFRNAVNYRPDYAYSGVRRTRILDSFSYLRHPLTYDFSEILERFEHRAISLTTNSINNTPQEVAKLLVDYTFILYSLVTDLHSEVLDRRRINPRSRDARTRFGGDNGLSSGNGRWPL